MIVVILIWFYSFWFVVWVMGNLGWVGYGGFFDGMWLYIYDLCDVGMLFN